MDSNHKQPWQKTQAEIYNEIYQTVQSFIKNGAGVAVLPLWLGERCLLITDTSYIKQGYSPQDIQVKTSEGWVSADRDDVDRWCATLGLVGPSEQFEMVRQAVRDNCPVPHEVLLDHASMAGLDKASSKIARGKQRTRTINQRGRLIDNRIEKPKVGDVVVYVLPNYSEQLFTVSRVMSYRNFDRTWIVRVVGIEQPFVVQRIVYDDDTLRWSIFAKSI